LRSKDRPGMKATPKARVSRLSLSVFYHSTENPAKVRKAVLNLIPPELRERVSMDEVVTQGHYGNEIGIITVTLKGKNAFKTLEFIICSMERVDRNILVATVSNRAGHRPSHLYFRVSKQEAYLGKVELMDGDDVIKVSVTVNGVRSVDQLRQFLEVLTSECTNTR